MQKHNYTMVIPSFKFVTCVYVVCQSSRKWKKIYPGYLVFVSLKAKIS
jgi:hypothetical protein